MPTVVAGPRSLVRRAAVAIAVPVAFGLTVATWVTNRGRPILGIEEGVTIGVAWLSFAALVLGLVVVGGVVATRVRDNHIGWLLIAAGLLHGLAGALLGYSYQTLVLARPLPGATIATWGSLWVAVPAGILTGFIILLFPDGRLPSSRWRWPVRLYAAVGVGYATLAAAAAWPRRGIGVVDLADAAPFLGDDAVARLWAAFMVLSILPLAAVVVRYVRGRADERAQIRWLASAGTATIGGQLALSIDRTSPLLAALAAATTVALPVAMAVAILRYRLYEIDRIISRTVSYGLIIATLGAVWAAGVIGLGTLLSTRVGDAGNDLVVAGATLAVVILFRPLRARVQAAVDRRFNRTGYQARQAVETLPDRLRDQVDLDPIRAEITATAITAVQPATASVALLARDRAGLAPGGRR